MREREIAGHGNGRAAKSELHVPPRKIQFAVTLTCPLAECHRVASDTCRYDTLSLHRGGFGRLCSGRSTSYRSPSLLPTSLVLRLLRSASPSLPSRHPSSFTSAHNLDSFIPLPISHRALSCARVSGNTRPRPQTRAPGRPATIPNQKAGVTLASFSLFPSTSLPSVSPRTRVRLTATVIRTRHRDGG